MNGINIIMGNEIIMAQRAQPTEILLICVNYLAAAQSRQFVRNFFADLDETRQNSNIHVVLVNQCVASLDDDSFRDLSSSYPNLLVVNSLTNLGYFGGIKFGYHSYLAYLGSESQMPRWVIVSNTDIAVSGLVAGLRKIPMAALSGVGVIAPRIVSGLDQGDQNPYLRVRPSKWKMHWYKWLFHFYPVAWVYHLMSHLRKVFRARFLRFVVGPSGRAPVGTATPIYAAHGSFMIFTAEYFRRGGDFNYPSFLFGEEIFVAEKVREMDLTVLYQPNLAVFHEEHQSTGLVPNRKILKFLAASAAFCADQYFPLFGPGKPAVQSTKVVRAPNDE